jgi:hypothetical protein
MNSHNPLPAREQLEASSRICQQEVVCTHTTAELIPATVGGRVYRRMAMESGRTGVGGNYGNEITRSVLSGGDPHVQEVLKSAHEELRTLLRQRAEIMKRIGTVKQTIVGLANMFGDDILSEELLELVDRKSNGRQPGFTKACRMVLMEAGRPLGAREVCEHIQEKIPPVLLRHKDPLASVTTVLNRLVEYGEARTVVKENGRRAWQWVSEPGSGERNDTRV